MSDFQELLDELDGLQLAKALAAKRKAKPGQADSDTDAQEGEEREEGEDEGDAPDAAACAPLQKAEGFDGDGLLKSFGELMDTRLQARDADLVKAVGGLMHLLKAQNESIAELHTQMQAFGSRGAGRKSVAQAAAADVSPQPFLAKALAAMEVGKISGHEYAVADVAVRQGLQVDPAIIVKVLSV
jgi:hypothetical protein